MRVALLVLLAAACSPSTSRRAAPTPALRLYTIECGTGTVSDGSMFADDGAYDGVAFDVVVPCFLIRHPQGDLLWDLGLPDAWAARPPPAGTITFRVPRTLRDQLAQLGLAPADIELISVSHTHRDHVSNAYQLAHATWIVDADERAHAFRPEARAQDTFAHYAALEHARTRLIEGDADHDVFGDGTVTIVQAPGHTPGHTVLLVRLPKAGPVILIGDLYHRPESRTHRRVPRFNTNRADTLASMDKVERLAKQLGARVVIEHSPTDFAALPAFPAYLE